MRCKDTISSSFLLARHLFLSRRGLHCFSVSRTRFNWEDISYNLSLVLEWMWGQKDWTDRGETYPGATLVCFSLCLRTDHVHPSFNSLTALFSVSSNGLPSEYSQLYTKYYLQGGVAKVLLLEMLRKSNCMPCSPLIPPAQLSCTLSPHLMLLRPLPRPAMTPHCSKR